MIDDMREVTIFRKLRKAAKELNMTFKEVNGKRCDSKLYKVFCRMTGTPLSASLTLEEAFENLLKSSGFKHLKNKA